MRNVIITDHAAARMNLRGAKPTHVHMLAQVADREIHLGDGACILSLSHRAAEKLRSAGLATAFVERLCKISLVISETDGVLITILKGALAPNYRSNGRHRHWRGRREESPS